MTVDPLRDQLAAPKSYPPKCPDCDGGESGMHRDGTPILCDTCEGSGFVDEQGAPTTVLDWREANARRDLSGPQSPAEDIRNALQILQGADEYITDADSRFHGDGEGYRSLARPDHDNVVRLLRHALTQLESPK